MDKCPNCKSNLQTAKFSDLETSDGTCFDIWIVYCPECRYVEDCYTD